MDTCDPIRLLDTLTPADVRERIADLDRERAGLVVLLRALTARQSRHRPPRESACQETRHGT